MADLVLISWVGSPYSGEEMDRSAAEAAGLTQF